MIFYNRSSVVLLLCALFAGAMIGYALGWYFSPKSSGYLPAATSSREITSSPSPQLPAKLSDITISEGGEVLISTPRPGDTVATPLMVNGLVRAFENQVGMRLKNKDGVVVRETTFTAKQGEIGTFISLGVDMTFAQPTVPGDGTFEAFTFSAKDGSEINKVTIPIKFAAHGGSGL